MQPIQYFEENSQDQELLLLNRLKLGVQIKNLKIKEPKEGITHFEK